MDNVFGDEIMNKKFISTSSVGRRWDRMVLIKKSITGNPHTCVFKDMWNGWSITIRTKDQMIDQLIGTVQNFERGYSARSLIDLPPPFNSQFD